MRSSAVEKLCLALGVLGFVGVIVCCTLPCWRVTAFEKTSFVTQKVVQEGLWKICVKEGNRQKVCSLYDSQQQVSPDLQAPRVLVVFSCILSGLSLFILFYGAIFAKYAQNEDAKPRILMVAAVGLLLGGFMAIIPVSCSAYITLKDILQPGSQIFQKTNIGVCLDVGCAAGMLLILTGGLVCRLSRPKYSSSGGKAKCYSSSASAPDNNYV
ncbi:claudin-4-like [Cyprinodon tularosa]|uniref:claudin-4-like n=1 Tax=Cyprinodon tularosa TaxID=77115 RepID=UPI0018E1E0EB|nr:claudin-4-like [Cyprinodon tularosa]